ncbi:MAG TPA: restriction endonuclease [Dehalococcoidia bacterium]|nr:restriction endonuclease [Dehalococcoidia bacterium]
MAICFGVPEDLTTLGSKDQVIDLIKRLRPEDRPQAQAMAAGQLYRFVNEIQRGDYVLTPLKAIRTVLIGQIDSDYLFNQNLLSSTCPHTRKVKWLAEKSRDEFSASARNTLGGLATVFKANQHITEIEQLLRGQPPTEIPEEPQIPFYEDAKAKADELIRDLLAKLDGYQFQRLAASVLRAMGYVAKVGPRGKDVGVDVLAHPDPFGFTHPRIKVQVKHRRSQASRPELQELSGALHQGEYGLFVSTGGFTTDAQAWVAQSGKPVTLIDGEGFVDLLLENCERLDTEAKALVPLKPVWMPVSQ